MRDFSNAPVRIQELRELEYEKGQENLNLEAFLVPLSRRELSLKNWNRAQLDRSANLQVYKLEQKKYGQVFSKD